MTDIQITPKYADVKPEGFYVYLHRRATDGRVFYVGKGKGRRAWSRVARSNHWHNTSKKNGIIVDIYRDGLSDSCALTLEVILIGLLGIENLVNQTLGGEGMSGFPSAKGLESPHHDKKIYEFWNDNEGLEVLTQFEFRNKYGLRASDVSSLCSGRRKSCKGWVLLVNKGKPIGHVFNQEGCYSNKDDNVYNFIHEDGRTIRCTQYELKKMIGSDSHVSCVVKGKRKTARGWMLA